MGRRICISVIGAGGEITPEEASTAAELGREIARRGAVVICGGLGGVMTEVAKGAKEEGGLTIGIIPGDNPAGANPFIDVAIVTGMGIARNVIVASSGDAVIAVSGKLGTLSEIALALIRQKPVIGLGTWQLEEGRIENRSIIPAMNAEDAVEKAFALIWK
ncbi:MAG TPA: TIGR00725 family protein [Candidatus Brocadiia bacterium]|nr:TIGR00725 family protein [Planctomycetota bacterium]MDO8091849.1 TIGR00725 family protein [Candidatus Brocadiales bacterium]